MNRNMRAADARPANMRRPEGTHPTAAACPEAYSATVPAKPAAMSAKGRAVSAATVSAAAAAGICFECDKRHDEEEHRGNTSASRHRSHGAAGLDAPHRRGRLSLGILPRTKSF